MKLDDLDEGGGVRPADDPQEVVHLVGGDDHREDVALLAGVNAGAGDLCITQVGAISLP